MCLLNTFPEIEGEGVSNRNIVFVSHTNILLEESVCVQKVCVWMSGRWKVTEEGLMLRVIQSDWVSAGSSCPLPSGSLKIILFCFMLL